MPAHSRRGVTLGDVVIVIAMAALLTAPLAAGIVRARERSNRVKCAANLKTIGQAMLLYANANKGRYPRTLYTVDAFPTAGTGAAAANAFTALGLPAPNDVTAAMFLLLRDPMLEVSAEVFVCPVQAPDIDVDADRLASAPDKAAGRSNFTDLAAHLSYSFANMYPGRAATEAGYKWDTTLSSDFAMAGDMNPGVGNGYDVTLPADYDAPVEQMRRANSRNHAAAGQNVLYGDGHVNFETNPFCGTKRDNAYTNAPDDTKTTSRLPPSGAGAIPGWAGDSVLLPTATRGAFPGTEPRTGWIIAGWVAAVALIVGGVIAARGVWARRGRRAASF